MEQISNILRRVAEGQETTLDVAADVLEFAGPPDENGDPTTTKVPRHIVTIERRALNAEPPDAPERFESPRRAHLFHDANGFIAYLQRYGTPATVVLADHATRTMEATINEEADDGFETVHLDPIPDPRSSEWSHNLGSALPIKQFARFIRANYRTVVKPDGHKLALLLSQITASRNATIQQGVGANSLNGIMIETTIQAKATTAPVDLPETITIKAPLFAGQDAVEIEIDILIEYREEQVVAVMTSHDAHTKTIEAFEAMLAAIQTGLALKTAVVALGERKTEPWNYLTK